MTPRVTFACARMRKRLLLQPRPIVIPAKAGIQYAAASRLIISSSAILDSPPSRAMTRRVTFAWARMRKRPLLQPRPAVIPAKAGIQYAAASRLIISSSAILDRPPSRAIKPRVTFAALACANGRFCSPAPPSYPRKRVSSTPRLSIDHQLLCNTGSPAFAGDDTARDIRLRSHAQTAAFAAPPNRHTRESGYPVRRGLSIDHQLLCNTGSPAFAGDDTASDLRLRSHAQRAAFAGPPNRHTRESGYPVRRACRMIIGSSAILDRPPSRAMTEWGSRVSAFSRRECVRVVPEFSAFP